MKAKEMTLFTNRNVFIFDELGEQISDYQRLINCYGIDKELAMKVTLEADDFFISDFGNWCHRISRKHMQYLLGLCEK